MRIKYYGHACFLLEGSKKVLIDPFISGNPLAPELTETPDLILVTHGHEDHVGDAAKIAEASGAKIVAIYELANMLPNAIGMNIGGSLSFGDVKIKMVNALHSSSFRNQYAGHAAGFIVEMDGLRVYHAGDTAFFEEMKNYACDVALLPIGDVFTMGIEDAIRAARLIKPRVVIPMHYDTFPIIKQDPTKLKVLEEEGIKVVILKPGEEFEAT